MPPAERFANPLTERRVASVRSIGIEVRAATVSHKTFLPRLENHPGAILHEASHVAVADPAQRAAPLRFYGLSREPRMAAVAPFPHMSRWSR
jgi:hypothetical protein